MVEEEPIQEEEPQEEPTLPKRKRESLYVEGGKLFWGDGVLVNRKDRRHSLKRKPKKVK